MIQFQIYLDNSNIYMVDNLIRQVLGNNHTYKQYMLMVNTIYNYMTSLRILPLSENYILLQDF